MTHVAIAFARPIRPVGHRHPLAFPFSFRLVRFHGSQKRTAAEVGDFFSSYEKK
jgi:hypothetical protein